MTTAQHLHDGGTPRSHVHPTHHQALAPCVLVVARDEHFLRWASGQLHNSGFEILVADGDYHASQAVDRDPPELIVVDHAVPWVGLLSRVRGDPALASIPVLLVAQQVTDSLADACRVLRIMVLVRRPGEQDAVLPVRELQTTQRTLGTGVRDLSQEQSP
jgi:CheY-like chemotaxis protein